MSEIKIYCVCTSIETTNSEGIIIPKDTVINEILWDGTSDWTAPKDTYVKVLENTK